MITTDLFIVGGGPAGLAAAIAARNRGFSVIVADARKPPLDKACGEGLLPDGVAALAELGVRVGAGDAVALRGIRFVAEDTIAEGRFGERCALGIRRTVLHRILTERAADAGVTMHWGRRVNLRPGQPPSLEGEPIRCEWLIGADGSGSRVREAARLMPISERRRIGVRQHFRMMPWSNFIEVHWHDRGQAYVTPVSANELCVAMIGCDQTLRMEQIGALFPTLADRINGFEPASSTRGGISSSMLLNAVVRDRIALVGDASGSVDAITGDGLSLALRQALALADALAGNDPALYQRSHRRICRGAETMARMLLLMCDHGWIRRRAIQALAARPQGFDRFLAIHARTAPPASARIKDIAGFVGRFLIAA
ncbi:MAG: NAD(P)/FAD-dependent oxidoreductase [Candidatus Binataceae bacterium]